MPRRRPLFSFYSGVPIAVVVVRFLAWTIVVQAFVPPISPLSSHYVAPISSSRQRRRQQQQSTTTALQVVGILAKKAKQAVLKEYIAQGVEDNVMTIYKTMKEKMASMELSSTTKQQQPGPLQMALTKRKGTITVIAEYKRKLSEAENGYINEMYDPELLSPAFREYGATAIAVLADERMGGCTYSDIDAFVQEQQRAQRQVPGPIPVINHDLIVDELQIAQSVDKGCIACVIYRNVVGHEQCQVLLQAAHAVDLEVIVAVSTPEEAQEAVDLGARLLMVVQVESVDDKAAVIQSLVLPKENDDDNNNDDHQQQQEPTAAVCTIATIMARNDKQLQEVEEAWMLRDKGFNAVWVGEALYKSGVDATEHPGAILKAMQSKSSVKWASPKGTLMCNVLCVLLWSLFLLVVVVVHCHYFVSRRVKIVCVWSVWYSQNAHTFLSGWCGKSPSK